MHLPRMDTIMILNWRFLHLASLNPRAPTVVVAALVTIKFMGARLPQPTQYPRTQHSLDFHAETKTATRYFLYPSKSPRQILRASRTDRPLHALQQAAYPLKVSNLQSQEANLKLHVSDATQRQARRGGKPIKISLPPLRTPRLLTVPLYLVNRHKPLSAKKAYDLAIPLSPHL